MRSDNPWQLKASKIVYENSWMRIREDSIITPAGKEGVYAFLESNNSVMICLLNENNELYLMRKFSYPVASWNWELPGGGGDQQNPLEAAKRELKEETGFEANTWIKLGTTRVCNGFMSERTVHFLAKGYTTADDAKADINEQADETKFAPMSKVDAMIKRGEINDGQGITGIHLAQKWLEKNG